MDSAWDVTQDTEAANMGVQSGYFLVLRKHLPKFPG
jgi:hypothetical protein